MKKDDFQDPYIDQRSGCIHNILDIQNPGLLSAVEADLSSARYAELENAPIPKTFDFEHLKAIHKHLFQDVYEWAGEARQVNISKGETHFLPCSLIERGAHSVFSSLKIANHLEGLPPDEFSKRSGHYLGEINHIHPFREGNGRTQRAFINQLAQKNGYYIEWKNVTQKQMVEASIEADKGNSEPLAKLIRENLADREIALFIKQNRSFEDGQAELFSAEAGKKYDGKIIGVTERHIMQASTDSPHHIIIHNRQTLSRTPDIDKWVEISYPYGDIGLVREPEAVKEKGCRHHESGKDSWNHEEHEWER